MEADNEKEGKKNIKQNINKLGECPSRVARVRHEKLNYTLFFFAKCISNFEIKYWARC